MQVSFSRAEPIVSIDVKRLFLQYRFICHAQSIEVKSKRPYEDAFSRITTERTPYLF